MSESVEPITAGQYAEILLGAEVARETPLGAAIEWALATIDEQAKEIARLKPMSEDWFRDEIIETLQAKLAAVEAALAAERNAHTHHCVENHRKLAAAEAQLAETIADAIEAMNGQARECGCWERIKVDFMKGREAVEPSKGETGALR